MTFARSLLFATIASLSACGPSRPAEDATPPLPTPADVHGPLTSTLAGKSGYVFAKIVADAHTNTVDHVDIVTKDVSCGDARDREDDVHLGFRATSAPGGPFELSGRVGDEQAVGWITLRSLDVRPGGRAQGSLYARGGGKQAPVVRGELDAIVCMKRYGLLSKTSNLVVEIDGVETKLPFVELEDPRTITFAEAANADGRASRDGVVNAYVKLGDTPGGELFDGSAFAPEIEVRLKTGEYMPVKGQLEIGKLRLKEYAPVHGKITVEKQVSSRKQPQATIAVRGTFDIELPEDEHGDYAWLTSRADPKKPALVAMLGDRTEDASARVGRTGEVEIVRGKDACVSTNVLMKFSAPAQAAIPTYTSFDTIQPMDTIRGWATTTDASGLRGWIFVTSGFADHRLRVEKPRPSTSPRLNEDVLVAGPFEAAKCN